MIRLMQVRDSEVLRMVEHLGEHYRSNISNRYIRPALLQLPLDNQSWDLIEGLMEKSEQLRYQGFHLDELYRQVAAAARFVALARRELAPTLRFRLGGGKVSANSDRVLREMAINNFSSNLKIFADTLNELYVKLTELDRADAHGRTPLYLQMHELQDIGRQLIG